MKAVVVKNPPVGTLSWVFIKGDGRNTAEAGKPEKLQKMATLELHKDSDEAKGLIEQINAVWELYKAETAAIKPATQPKSLGYKPVKDKDTGADTDTLAFQFKTNSFFPDGKPNNVKVYNAKGQEVQMGETIIGNGSIGVVHGSMGGYTYTGSYGVSLYLTAVQVAKLVEGTGAEAETTDISAVAGDDSFDSVGDGMPAVNAEAGEQPKL